MTLKIATDGTFTISGKLDEARPSASGKTTVLFSTHGNQATTAQYQGKPVVVGLNMYVK